MSRGRSDSIRVIDRSIRFHALLDDHRMCLEFRLVGLRNVRIVGITLDCLPVGEDKNLRFAIIRAMRHQAPVHSLWVARAGKDVLVEIAVAHCVILSSAA